MPSIAAKILHKHNERDSHFGRHGGDPFLVYMRKSSFPSLLVALLANSSSVG